MITLKLESIRAGIFGAVVADALGVPYEFSSTQMMKENPATTMTGYGTYNQPPGTWSDDSSMTLATMDSLKNGVNYEDMMKKFCQWYQDAKYTPHNEVFDIGNTTRSALDNYIIHEDEALDCGLTGTRDNGNGSLMRILPATFYAYAKDYTVDEQIIFIDNLSSLTHAHSYSKAACNIYNMIVQEVLQNPEEDFKKNISTGLDKSRKYYDNDDYPCFITLYDDLFGCDESILSNRGYVVYSLEVALYCSYHTISYHDAVLKAVNLGGDTDTNAMITGGLAALYYGLSSIPEDWLEKIVKKDYIEELCVKFHNSLQ